MVEMPAAMVTTWNEIWGNDKRLNRKYNYDFEVYGEDAQKGENSKVDIYVPLKG
ncbi:putative transcriptional regulator YdeE [Pedobacter sp. UYP30]|uniref:effector binding domain-containing protein n=1 Tax=Pedobacter sp. UYP30 TaxID=1756400 RepID=UPI003393B0CB